MGSKRPIRGGDDRPSLTLNHLAEGTIIAMDLDRFGETVKEKGLSEYRPNTVTGTLTRLVEKLVEKHGGLAVYGLDHRRGTEEAVIEIPYHEPADIAEELEEIRKEIERLGATITIAAVKDYVLMKKASKRREAYTATPGRRRAAKLLRKAKRRGGNTVIIA